MPNIDALLKAGDFVALQKYTRMWRELKGICFVSAASPR